MQYLIVPLALMLASCASVSTLPMSNDLVQITARAAPACGPEGAQKVALRQGAVETINRGYDRFYIVGADSRSDIRVVGTTPVRSTTTASGTISGGYGGYGTFSGTSFTTSTGGTPIYGGSHNQQLFVKMFNADDPEAANALDARQVLGEDWEEKIKEKAVTCL